MAADYAPIAVPESGAGLSFVAILTFVATAQGTDYRAVVRHRNGTDAEMHRKMGFFEGWTVAADQLDALAVSL